MAKGVLLLLGRDLLQGILQHRTLIEQMLKVAAMRGDWKGVNEGAYIQHIDHLQLLSAMKDFELNARRCFASAILEHNSIHEQKLYDAVKIRLLPWTFTLILDEFNEMLSEVSEQTKVQIAARTEFPRIWKGVISLCLFISLYFHMNTTDIIFGLLIA